LDKERYVIARKSELDTIRPSVTFGHEEAKQLRLITKGKVKIPSFEKEGKIKHMDFYNPTQITDESAQLFRKVLNLAPLNDGITMPIENHEDTGASDTSDERILREILARRGQPKFRSDLFAAYDAACCVTGSKVSELLEAAHIDAHSDGGNYQVTNGLLLRSDIHTLFDRYLLCIDEYNRIRLSKTLINSEYKEFHMKKYRAPRPSAIPDSVALKRRYVEFLKREEER
jgi:hypothetical protein